MEAQNSAEPLEDTDNIVYGSEWIEQLTCVMYTVMYTK